MQDSIGDTFDFYDEQAPELIQLAIDRRDGKVVLPDKETVVTEAMELLQCSRDEALWGVEAACVTPEQWADDTEREAALARIRGAFEELDTGQATNDGGPEQTSPSVPPPSQDEHRCTNGPGAVASEVASHEAEGNLRFVRTGDGITCRHENTTEGVDDDGNLAEPAYDVCLDCGERIN
jgi:hypothetical protein